MDYDDDGLRLECSVAHRRQLLRASYSEEQFSPDANEHGIYRYWKWLPIRRKLAGAGNGIVYRSDALAKLAGLRHVWVAFYGYWPERGATLTTCTFKELEAYTVLSRLSNPSSTTLVVASAGNTAAAFARACALNREKCLLIVPETALPGIRLVCHQENEFKVVALAAPADYADAIQFAAECARLPGFTAEGGTLNIARRDGLGSVMLNAGESMGRLPDYYFQAVGSGAGGISVHGMAQRLLRDGRFGSRLPRLFLSQNLPFAPMYKRWNQGLRDMGVLDNVVASREISETAAKVLCNRRPAYEIGGGVVDVLSESGGQMLAASNSEAKEAAELFEAAEHIDISEPASVAFATLLKAGRGGQIDAGATVLLNVTGGGRRMRDKLYNPQPIHADFIVDLSKTGTEPVLEQIAAAFGRSAG
jgi:cysteate synthase